MKNNVYKILKYSNDIKAIKKGRILQRLWNRLIGKHARRLMK